MFLIDKYNVNSLDDVILHKNIYKKLIIGFDQKNKFHDLNKLQEIIKTKQYHKIDEFDQSKNDIYNNYNSMPNLLIHGPAGCGKHTLLKLLLEDIYDSSVNNLTTVKYNICGYGNKVVEVDIKQSKYHLIIEPNNTALDKYLIQEVVKEYAKKKLLMFHTINFHLEQY